MRNKTEQMKLKLRNNLSKPEIQKYILSKEEAERMLTKIEKVFSCQETG